MQIEKYFGNKKIGYLDFNPETLIDENSKACRQTKDCFIILHVKKGGNITVDFMEYEVETDTLFFFNLGQHFYISKESAGNLIYFNPEFYCIAFHDKELTCDGVLFNNVFESPIISLESEEANFFFRLSNDLEMELKKRNFWTEEMARTYLKQIIIMASRIWKRENSDHLGREASQDEIGRKFSQYVERFYNKYHSVADYADLLNVSPKSLNRRIVQEKKESPNYIIKNRIVLQAKRLLINTELSIKEIATQLGYDDVSYFVRFFKIQTGISPLTFRKGNSLIPA